MAGIKDVAKLAGVSTTAVSFVLNGRYDQLSEETIRRVQEAMAQLDYRPSRLARGLAKRRSGILGVLVRHLRHPVSLFLVSTIVTAARRRHYDVLIWDEVVHAAQAPPWGPPQPDLVAHLISQGIDGLITSAPLADASLAKLTQRGIPRVAVDQLVEECDSVAVDWAAGARLAVAHLRQLGRRQLLVVGQENPWQAQGVQEELAASPGLELVGTLVAETPLEAYDGLAAILQAGRTFDAIYVTSDYLAMGVYRALESHGRRIPDEVAVVGFDDTFAGFLSPALTSVAQPFPQLGEAAVTLLLERLEGATTPPRQVRVAPSLVVRESCGAGQVAKRQLLAGLWERDLPATAPEGGRQA